MPSNVEIKAKVPDGQKENIHKRAAAIRNPGTVVEILNQTDEFYACGGADGARLKLRNFGNATADLIWYRRPNNTSGPRESVYYRVSLQGWGNIAEMSRILQMCHGQPTCTVRKLRELYMCGQTRIHLDNVDHLGDFVELEVVMRPDQAIADGEAIARDLMSKLGLRECDLVKEAYADLLMAK